MARQASPISQLCEEAAVLALGMAVLGYQRASVAVRTSVGEPTPARVARVAAALAEPAVAPLRAIAGRACAGPPTPGD